MPLSQIVRDKAVGSLVRHMELKKHWTCSGQAVVWRNLKVRLQGRCDESVHVGSNSKRPSGNCCCLSACQTDSHICACHSTVEASKAQQASHCRFCVIPWSHDASPTNGETPLFLVLENCTLYHILTTSLAVHSVAMAKLAVQVADISSLRIC